MVALVVAVDTRREVRQPPSGVWRPGFAPAWAVLTFADEAEVAEFLALLRGEPYLPTRTGSR